MRFFVGVHHPHRAKDLKPRRVCISYNALRKRRSDIAPGEWLLDSGAFTTLEKWGTYPDDPDVYAAAINRWSRCGTMLAAVSQDYMCEPFMLERTGLSVADHQRLTIERYDALLSLTDAPVMPVLQGYKPAEYMAHLAAYGDRLAYGAWVGVGSVCKRNTDAAQIAFILHGIKRQRPDLRLHGFGVKASSLASPSVREALWSADSMAWSYAARMEGRNGNCWTEAARFYDKLTGEEDIFAQARGESDKA